MTASTTTPTPPQPTTSPIEQSAALGSPTARADLHAAPGAPSVTSAIIALAWRELVRFFRQRSRVIGGLVQPILFWFFFSEGLRSSDLGYGHFFPGTLVMVLLFTAIFATISVIEDRNAGFLQGVLVAPAPRWAIAAGKVLGGAAIAWLQATLFFALGWGLLAAGAVPDESLTIGVVDAAAVLGGMVVLAVALTGLGFVIAWRMDSTQGFHAIMSLFLLPMWLLSGAFFPRGAEGWLGGVVAVNPLTYGVAALRWRLEGGEALSGATGGLPAEPLCWAVTFAFAAAMLVASWCVAGVRR